MSCLLNCVVSYGHVQQNRELVTELLSFCDLGAWRNDTELVLIVYSSV